MMIGGAVASWAVAATVAGPAMRAEVLLGMLGPLLVAVASWALAERTYRLSPERLTDLMAMAFAGKMLFFGAYVAIALMGLALRPTPFVVSFTAYFIGLHVTEAFFLRRMFAAEALAER